MSKKKRQKPAHEMTSEEIAKRVFPREVHEHLKKVANPEKKPSRSSQDKSK